MARTVKLILILFWLSCVVFKCVNSDLGKEMMENISLTIGRAILECEEENKISPSMSANLMLYWYSDSTAWNTEVGCAFLCAFRKMEIDDPNHDDYKNRLELIGFANGRDDRVTKKTVDLFYACSQNNATNSCSWALELVKCFKDEAVSMGWIPTFN